MRSIVVGTAGHIDHGKSALVLALTGTNPDRLKEEKARGITIDLGFAHVAIGDVSFAFVDVPGHERFIKNMLAGVGGIDLAVLVVAANESVMPQTREHFDICRLLRVPTGVIVLTKADLVDDDMLDLVDLEVRELVAGSFLEGAPIVPVSSRTGQGLDALRAALGDAARRVLPRSSDGATRLPIDRVFSMRGFGTIVTGTLVSGRVRADDQLVVAPGGRSTKVRGVQVHGVRKDVALAGQRVALNLGGVEVGEIQRGQTLVAPGTCEETQLADAVLDLLPGTRPLKDGDRVRFHQGTAEILGRVATIGPRPSDVRHGTACAIAPGARAFVRLRLERSAVLTRGDRFIIRAYSPQMTIGGGQILDPQPPRAGLRGQVAVDRCRTLDFDEAAGEGGQSRALELMVQEAGDAGLPLTALVSRAGIEPARVHEHVDALIERKAAERVGDVLVTRGAIDALKKAIVDVLAAHHAAAPLSEGLPREEVRGRLFARGHPAVFDRAVEEIERAGTIAGHDRLGLSAHRLVLSPEEEEARAKMEAVFRQAGLRPPDPSAATSGAGVAPEVAERVIKLLLREKILVRVDTLLFHDEALKRLKETVSAFNEPSGAAVRIDVAVFKQRFGLTRKFAIPLLEYLDRERVTRRLGDLRLVV